MQTIPINQRAFIPLEVAVYWGTGNFSDAIGLWISMAACNIWHIPDCNILKNRVGVAELTLNSPTSILLAIPVLFLPVTSDSFTAS